jgi:hypothetical protein
MDPQWETTLFCFVCDRCEDGSEQSYVRAQGVELALLSDLARSDLSASLRTGYTQLPISLSIYNIVINLEAWI